MTHPVRILEPSEFRAAHALFGASIHRGPVTDDRWAASAHHLPVDRTLGAHDGAVLVGTATSFASRTVVPGGAVLPMAAVTGVGVRADRTRRGVLTALMRAQLADVAARGEPLASLRASQTAIYGRFGYGLATRARGVRVRAERTAWRATAPTGGSVRLLDRPEVVPVLRALHDSIALHSTGAITRWDRWWAGLGQRVDDREHVLAAVHTGAHGDDGFALARLGGEGSGPGDESFDRRTLHVEDLHAADVAATAGLWRFLLGIDLIGAVRASMRPLDEPLELLLDDPRDCVVTEHEDEAWLRLVDVPAALAARSFAPADPVLIAVHDPLLPQNAGVYRIADGSAERAGPLGGPVEPQLECDVAALSMAYLGDRTPAHLVATGWWRARSDDAVRHADAAFRTASVPWCGTFF